MLLNLTNLYQSTNETRAALEARIAAGDFVIAPNLNTTNLQEKCYKLAVVDPDYLGLTELRGVTLGSGLVVLAVQYGDSNCDGVVTFDDYTEWEANLLSPSPLNHFERGAFNGLADTPGEPFTMPNYLIWVAQFVTA
jgi:hypothetical protein